MVLMGLMKTGLLTKERFGHQEIHYGSSIAGHQPIIGIANNSGVS